MVFQEVGMTWSWQHQDIKLAIGVAKMLKVKKQIEGEL
jgi:hypothetical protein